MNAGFAVAFVAGLLWIGAAISATIGQAHNLSRGFDVTIAAVSLVVVVATCLIGIAIELQKGDE